MNQSRVLGSVSQNTSTESQLSSAVYDLCTANVEISRSAPETLRKTSRVS